MSPRPPLLLLGIFCGLARLLADPAPPPSAERGRQLYERGTGTEGRRVPAFAGADGVPLPKAFAACLNCHGPDGRGRTEGGLTVPPIAWDQLDTPYGATRADGRRRAAYDEASFHQALTRGLDSSGQALATAMPRYSLTPQESADLAAYLRQIGQRAVPGVNDDTILLGWHAPAGMSAIVAGKVLEAWAAEVNAAGGVFRRLVKPLALGEDTPPVFAAITAGEGKADLAVPLALARNEVPVLVAGHAPGATPPQERWLFALFPAGPKREPVGGEMSPQAVEDYLAFVRRHHLPAEERDLQLVLLGSARLLLEGLKNTGRDLDRDRFLAALESLSDVETGFTPPATFTRRSHVATSRGYAKPERLGGAE